MEMKIYSIKQNEFITPKSNAIIDLRTGTYAYIEVRNKAEVRWGNRYEEVQKGDVLIGTKFLINNEQNQSLTLRGFVFNCYEFDNRKNHLHIFKEPLAFREITSIFNNTICPEQMSKRLTDCIPNIIKQVKAILLDQQMISMPSKEIIDKRLILINRYIRKNFHKPLTLQDLAEIIECNPIYLSNTYSKVFRISPMRFVQNLRMKKARELLITNNLNIGEIANNLGYVSGSQFSELFKRYYHITPSQFRVQNVLNRINLE